MIRLDKNDVMASDDIDHVKKAYEITLRDKERFERWFCEAQEMLDELIEKMEDSDAI